MAPLKVKVNPYFKENYKPYIDPLSKFYLYVEGICGLNRFPVIMKDSKSYYLGTSAVCVYSLITFSLMIYATYDRDLDIVYYSSLIEYCFCVVFSFIGCKRLDRFYNEINKFDINIGCRPKMTSDSVRNCFAMIFFTTLSVLLYVGSFIFKWSMPLCIEALPIILLHALEVYYYGHLLSLLIPRLRLINYYVEIALSTGKLAKRPKVEELMSFKNKNSKNSEMKTLMDLYHIVINSYDYLIDAIKWQLLVILISTFVCTLSSCYYVSISIIRDANPLVDILTHVGTMASDMIPLFSTCVFGDRVHGEVRRLRELLASRLYENKLDKPGRSSARALLALTEARDLSFSLLRMLQIDISLPFKFIGLLVTYLIILLQFEKVINPSSKAISTTISPASLIDSE